MKIKEIYSRHAVAVFVSLERTLPQTISLSLYLPICIHSLSLLSAGNTIKLSISCTHFFSLAVCLCNRFPDIHIFNDCSHRPPCLLHIYFLPNSELWTLNKFHSFSDKALTLPLKCQLQLRCKAVRAQEAHNKQSL